MHIVRDLPQLCCDAAVWDAGGTLVFMSLWGRDTILQQFIAELSVPVTEGGRNDLVLSQGTHVVRLAVPPKDWIAKLTGRAPAAVPIAGLTQVWIHDRRASDRSLHRGSRCFVLSRSGESSQHPQRVWQALRQIATVPLLDTWAAPILEAFCGAGWIQALPALGQVIGTELRLPEEDRVAALLGQLLRSDPLAERFTEH